METPKPPWCIMNYAKKHKLSKKGRGKKKKKAEREVKLKKN